MIMTEKFFEAHGVKKDPMKGGFACLLNIPIPDWAVKQKKDGTIDPRLWDIMEEMQYIVSFVPFYSRGKHAGEPNWKKENERTMFNNLDEAEAFMKSMVGKAETNG